VQDTLRWSQVDVAALMLMLALKTANRAQVQDKGAHDIDINISCVAPAWLQQSQLALTDLNVCQCLLEELSKLHKRYRQNWEHPILAAKAAAKQQTEQGRQQ